jgi:hypothetical protein
VTTNNEIGLNRNLFPQAKPSGEDQASPGKPKKEKVRSHGEAFEKIWQMYPANKRGSKSKTFAHFQKMTPEEQEALPGSITAYLTDYWSKHRKGNKGEDAWIKHLEGFIRDRYYENYAPPPPVDNTPPPPPEEYTPEKWTLLIKQYRLYKRWRDAWGKPPGEEGSLVPRELWTEDEILIYEERNRTPEERAAALARHGWLRPS